MKDLLYYKYHPEALPPSRPNETDGGNDVYALESVFIPLGKTAVIPLGLAIYIPEGYIGQFIERSSIGKKGLAVGGGLIDATFSGELSVILHNLTCKEDTSFFGEVGYQIEKGDRVAQLVIQKVETPMFMKETKVLWKSIRGTSAFGSSGS